MKMIVRGSQSDSRFLARTMPPRKPKQAQKREIPDELLPLVDAVVDMVFVRLKRGVAQSHPPSIDKRQSRAPVANSKRSSKRPPWATDRAALAGALADLLLADLTRLPTAAKKRRPAAASKSTRPASAANKSSHPASAPSARAATGKSGRSARHR